MAASPKRKAFGYDGTADAETTPDAPGKALTQANSDSNSDSDKDGHVMHKINDPDPSITKGAENISTTVAVVQNNVPFNSEEEGEVQIQLDGARTEPHPAEVINFPIDHDDFPFLQNFLSRSQARKAAKHDNPRQDAQSCDGPIEMASHASEEPTPTCVEGSGGGGLEASTTSPVGDRNDLSTTPSYSHTDIGTVEPDQEADVNLSSPCRRSSRLNGKAARPKKPAATLPSNISLKRLNGTEFIATQREAQPLAVTTRTNTKRNKGDSVSVKVKLIQLHAEEKARESDPNTGTQEVSRNKPVSKQVKWDDTLARFEDGSIFHNDRDGEALDDEADKLEQSSDKEADQNQQEPPKPSEPAQAEDKPARKVRKLRKLNVGSVNGTPGPKRTTSIPVPVGAGSLEKLTDIIAKGKGGEAKVAGGERAQTRYQRQLRKSG
ncbi:hypothetical protein A1O3_02053 [Capronia epimyces CBS 606.96]|uniref:Uncharacterized protein n=1 Tax=Capronia epimyces CBS 606.96 TaxID=1182542 RepID=W9Z3B3_9EURO|nr:uncharacterized protein A1O3_02053 [Capronia epimyces CBS 606.96]EXJ88989.1 hypothetical protein A1O3_02053 [Capronia epimyces CBS 606.96]